MRKSTTTTRTRMVRAGLATGASSALLVALGTAPAFAAVGTLTLSSVFGPTAGGNTVTATITTNPTSPNPTQFTTSTNAQFVAAPTTSTACPAIYTAPGTNLSATVRYLSPQKIAVTVPSGVVLASGATATNYKLCTYNGTTTGTGGSAVVAQGNYTVGTKPKITSVSPGGGPSLGGTTVTVKGENFTSTNLSATIGGQALTDVKYIDANTFTATTPAMKAGGPLLLTVTTPGGTANTIGDTTTKANLFTYANGIVVSPNTAPNNNNTPVDVDINGVGFMSIDFPNTSGFTPNASGGHVYLVRGSYNPADNAGAKTLGQTDECTNVIVIADNELLCSLGLTTAGPATKVTAVGETTSGSTALVGTGFAATDVGRAVTGPGIPAGTYIAGYTSATSAALSANATATATGLTITIGGPRTATIGTTSGSTAVTGAAGTFVSTDTGRYVTGPGIPAGTTLTYVSGTSATLSSAATATNASASVSIANQGPVPVDSYTMTVVSNGGIDVQTGGANVDADYTKSVVSSGSTFTVSDF